MLEGLRILRNLNYASLELFDHLISSESLSCDYRKDGWLLAYKTAKGFQKAREDTHLLEAHDNDYLREIGNLEIVDVWYGFRPCTPDGLPIIDKFPGYDNLIVATGHCMLGVSLAPITGKLVSQLICGETPDVNLKLLRAARFR